MPTALVQFLHGLTAGGVRDLHIERQPLLFRHAKHEQADGFENRKAHRAQCASGPFFSFGVDPGVDDGIDGHGGKSQIWAKRMVDIATGEASDREPTPEEQGKGLGCRLSPAD